MEIGVAAGPGFERYEAAFSAKEIDERVLPSLTAQDLKDLGVALVGQWRRHPAIQ